MHRPLRALRMGRVATRSKIGVPLMTRMSAIAQLGAAPPLRERLRSAPFEGYVITAPGPHLPVSVNFMPRCSFTKAANCASRSIFCY